MSGYSDTHSTQAPSFERDTVDAVAQARETYARVIELKCPESRAVTAVSESLGIHRKLAWQLIKVAYSEDPFVAAKHMPSKRSVEALRKAASAHGVDQALISAISDVDARFARVMETHASDKAEFDMLVEAHCRASEHRDDARWRQLAYDGNSYTWGAHCRTLLALTVMMPSLDRDRYFDVAQIKGLMGFRQTRPGVRWLVNQSVAVDDAKRPESAMWREPMDRAAADAHNGVPVLPEFCSDPVPELTRTETMEGMVEDEFESSLVGLPGERTLVTGEILRNLAPVHATEQDKIAHFGSAVRTPSEILHFDMYVRAGMFGDVERELCVFSDISSSIAFGASDELMVDGTIGDLGTGIPGVEVPELPGYHDLARGVFARLGVDPAQYELFRIRIAYPPFPASAMVRHPLLPLESIPALDV